MQKFRFESRRYSSSGNYGPGGSGLGIVIAKWLILTASVMLTAYIIEDINVSNFLAALFGAGAIGLLNLFFRPIILILTLPINILTLGLFTFIINAMMLKIASTLIPGFTVIGFWTTVFGAILISLFNWLLNSLISDTRGPRPPGRRKRDPESIDMQKKGDRWE